MIFDTARVILGNTGFIVVDTPPLGGRRPFWRLHRPVHRVIVNLLAIFAAFEF
jgi:hypothetical protein